MKKNKPATKETLIKRETKESEGNLFVYDLLIRENTKLSGFRLPLYSIRVGFTDTEGCYSEAEASEAFADPGKALLFYEKLVRNLATPIDIAYILEDELSH